VYLLLDIFGYLSVVLRGLILIAQSFTLGGLAFQLLLWEPWQPQLAVFGLSMAE
jgi:putative copper resistance protein D